MEMLRSAAKKVVGTKQVTRALKAGTATITVTSVDNESKKATCTLTVLSGNAGGGGIEGIDFDDWNFN